MPISCGLFEEKLVKKYKVLHDIANFFHKPEFVIKRIGKLVPLPMKNRL